MATAKAAKGTAAKAKGTVRVPMRAKAAPATKPEPTARQKSRLTEIGDEAMKRALHKSLKEHGWALTKVSDDLRLGGSANVLRAIRQLGLTDAYLAAKQRGDVKPGPRPA